MPEAPFQPHSSTSRAAAKAVNPSMTGYIRGRILSLLVRDSIGMTDEALSEAMPEYRPETVRVRRVELMHAGKVKDSGNRLRTSSGCWATLWVLAQ